MSKFKSLLPYFIILLLSIGTIIPLFNSVFFEFHDNTQLARVYEMAKSLSSGMFPVRWVSDLGYGYGYPIFNFYAPLPYYIGGLFSLIGFDLLVSTKLMFGIGILLSGVSMFLLSKKFFGGVAGVVSAIIYLYFPYHAVNIYVRGAVSEFFAYAFLPLFFLGIFSLIEIKNRKNITSYFPVIFSITLSIFLISTSHNLSIFMVMLIYFPTIMLILIFSKNKRDTLAVSILSIFLGFCLSAFYILPAFVEMNYTNVASQVGGGSDFKDHFVCLSQYWNSMWGYGGSVPGCIDGVSYKLGKTNILFLGLSLIFLIYAFFKKRFKIQEKVTTITLVILLLSLLLTLRESQFVWENIPFMSYLQFPWRFINFIALFASFIIGYGVYVLQKQRIIFGYIAGFVIIALTLFYMLKLFNPQNYKYFQENKYISEENLKFKISKISDEYMPKGFVKPKKLEDIPEIEAYFVEEGNIKLIEKKVQYQSYEYNLKKDSDLIINTAYFPSWKAFVNGIGIEIIKTRKGMMSKVPAGSGIFELKFIGTKVQNLSNIITFATIIAGILIVIYSKIKKYGK